MCTAIVSFMTPEAVRPPHLYVSVFLSSYILITLLFSSLTASVFNKLTRYSLYAFSDAVQIRSIHSLHGAHTGNAMFNFSIPAFFKKIRWLSIFILFECLSISAFSLLTEFGSRLR